MALYMVNHWSWLRSEPGPEAPRQRAVWRQNRILRLELVGQDVSGSLGICASNCLWEGVGGLPGTPFWGAGGV
jgi:hypothetical protein